MVDGALLTDHGPEYRIRTKEDRVYHFPKGFARINQRGALEYPVGRIADLCGNWWDFDRHGDRLTGINESAGRRIDLEMENGRIKEVALRVPGTDVRHTFVRYEYDQAGDLVTAIDALGHAYRFAYDEHHLVRHTDRNGLSFHYEYDKEGEDWRVVHSWGDGGLYNYHFEYIDLLKERRITDSLGHVSIVKLDDRGLPICETDALGGRTIYEYDDAGRTAAVVDQDGHRTQFAYDDHGNLVELTRPDGGKILTEFDSSNKATAVVDPGGAVWRQLWDVRGLLIEQTTPLGNISRYEYDAAGRLVTYVNPRGSRTELSLDEVGNLAGVKDALGHATLFTYDVLGNVTARRDPLGRRTLYRYDARSQLVEIVLPSGARVGCAYDGEGDLNRYVDERGVETRLQYQGLGELARRIQGDGSTVHYHYDTEERLVGVTNERGERYDIERDAIGRIVRERDYWGQVRHSRYSAAGHIQQIVDPLGRAVSYVTDPLSRVVRKVLPDPDGSSALWEERFSYDANGNLVACANPHIAIERRVDLEGRLLEERQGDRFTIWNTYDEVGNRTARTTEVVHDGARSSHRIGFAYDPLDQVTSIAINDHPPIAIERDVAGQIVAERLNAVLVREIGYTADGLRSRQRVKGGPATVLDVGYAYDAVGNLTARTETGYGTDRYTYDPLGRVTDHLDPLGRLTQYLNDPAGDRLRTRIVEREVVRSARDVRGPDMLPSAGEEWAREGEYKGTSFGFDRAGNLVERRDHDGHLTLRWDANQRLIESRIDGTTTRYRYDPLGRRIDKQTGEGRTEFAWDGDALVGDSVATKPDGTSAASIREWVYFPDTHEPVALLDGTPGSESILHYHNDPNGCPTTLTDGSGQVKWAAAFTVWGEVAALREHAVDNPIRFQGQYYDSETGFAYNRFRYYSCALGQFIGDDPLRLVAGDNLNWWAPNALRWIDPLGLTCKAIALGKDIPGGGLKGLAQQQGASWWRHWAKDGVTRRTVDNRFGRAFHQAADRAEHIHFSLDGIDHVADAVKAGRAGFKPGNFTHAELAHLASRPDLLEKTTFYRAGQVVPSPF
jgi:RHS repeat-associated protein